MTTSGLHCKYQAKNSLPAIVLVFGFLISFSCAQSNVSFTGKNGKDQCQRCCQMRAEERLLKNSVPRRRTEDAHASTGDSHDTHASTNSHSSTHDNSHGTHASNGHDSASNSHASGGHASGGHGSGGHGSGGHHQWWNHEYEYIHFENMVLVALVTITLIFDEIHHRSEEIASRMGHSGLMTHYVAKEEEEHHVKHSRSMWEEYFLRFNGELTVLGFLALTVWCTNQAGVFEDLAEFHWSNPSKNALPRTNDDYLHTVEEVHIFLFVTMCCYFYYIGIIVYFATRLNHQAVEANWDIKQAYKNGEIVDGKEKEYYSSKPRFFRMFFILRHYFFHSLQQWRGTWPFLDDHLKFFRAQMVANAKLLDSHVDPEQKGMVLLMRKWFPFDLYYAVNYRHAIDELIEISWVTWFIIMVTLLISAHIHGHGQVEIDVPLIAMILSQCLLFVMLFTTYNLYNNAKSQVKLMWAGNLAPLCWVHKFYPVRWMLRMFQVCVFMTLYELASTIACKREWKEHTAKGIAYLCIILFALVPEGVLMAHLLPLYSTLISTGPYMQEKHVIRLAAIVKAYDAKDPVHLRELAENVEEFDEQAFEIEMDYQTESKKRLDSVVAGAEAEEKIGHYVPEGNEQAQDAEKLDYFVTEGTETNV